MLGFARALGDYGVTQMVAGQMIDGTETASIHVMDALYGGAGARTRATWRSSTTVVGVALLYLANRLTRGSHLGRPWLS